MHMATSPKTRMEENMYRIATMAERGSRLR